MKPWTGLPNDPWQGRAALVAGHPDVAAVASGLREAGLRVAIAGPPEGAAAAEDAGLVFCALVPGREARALREAVFVYRRLDIVLALGAQPALLAAAAREHPVARRTEVLPGRRGFSPGAEYRVSAPPGQERALAALLAYLCSEAARDLQPGRWGLGGIRNAQGRTSSGSTARPWKYTP